MSVETRKARPTPFVWGLAVVFVLPAVAGAQLTHYEITDGPGKGEVIAAGKASKPGNPKPVDKKNNPINNANGQISVPDSGCTCNHYHGSLNGKGDPRPSGTTHPLGCGWGCVGVVGKKSKSKPSTGIRSARLFEARALSEFMEGDTESARKELRSAADELLETASRVEPQHPNVNRSVVRSRLLHLGRIDMFARDFLQTFFEGELELGRLDREKRTFANALAPLGL